MSEVIITDNSGIALNALKKAIPRALEICGGMAESYAKGLCPVDTGNLRNSISHAPGGENEMYIGTNVEYAPYVELGTRRMAAKPYLRPAAEGHAEQYKQVIEAELHKG